MILVLFKMTIFFQACFSTDLVQQYRTYNLFFFCYSPLLYIKLTFHYTHAMKILGYSTIHINDFEEQGLFSLVLRMVSKLC